jgi:hypothetical protein
MDILLFIVVWLALCAAVAAYARSKGHSETGSFLLALFLSPLVGFVFALAMQPDEKKVAAAQGKKKCPQCAEFVQPEAKICRFCQHKFTEDIPPEPLTEAEELAARVIPAGPPCPKCGSIHTTPYRTSVKASRWWKIADATFVRCWKCDEKWQPEDSVTNESSALLWTGLAIVLGLGCLVLLFVLSKGNSSTNKILTGSLPAPTSLNNGSASGSTEKNSLPQVSAPPTKASAWRVEPVRIDPMDGSKLQFISTPYIGGCDLNLCFENQKPCKVPVYVRAPGNCIIESNIVGEDYTGYERSVRIRFDDEKPITERWTITDDRKAIAPRSPELFKAALRKHKTLWVEFGCDASDNDTVFFNIEGMDEALRSAGIASTIQSGGGGENAGRPTVSSENEPLPDLELLGFGGDNSSSDANVNATRRGFQKTGCKYLTASTEECNYVRLPDDKLRMVFDTDRLILVQYDCAVEPYVELRQDLMRTYGKPRVERESTETGADIWGGIGEGQMLEVFTNKDRTRGFASLDYNRSRFLQKHISSTEHK